MKIKTAELIDAPLDWAVSTCVGIKWQQGDLDAKEYGPGFNPSTDWSQGGPIIERESISITKHADQDYWWAGSWNARYVASGPTPLVAAMCCFVASEMGNEVDVPEELLK